MLFLNSLLYFIIILFLSIQHGSTLIEIVRIERETIESQMLEYVNDQEPSDNDDVYAPYDCSLIDCSDVKIVYFKNNHTCPSDSVKVDATKAERQCCNIESKCECKTCTDPSGLNQCTLTGINLEPLLLRKGENIPSNCCNQFICTAGNYTCSHNGQFYLNEAKWKVDRCTECSCHDGTVKCTKHKCEPLNCEVKQSLNGDCCPLCTGECKGSNGKIYKNGEKWSHDDDCMRCECKEGRKQCFAESCAPLPCSNPVKTQGICCKHCPEDEILKVKFPPHCKSIVANFKCNLTCNYGLKLNGNRCPKCECDDSPIKKCSFPCDSDLAYMPLNDRMCLCTHQCQEKCNILCVNGYKKGLDGCDICVCNENVTSVANNLQTCFDYKTRVEYPEGSTWFDGCRQCACHKGRQYCSLINCNIKCLKPIYLKDKCCPICNENEQKSQIRQLNTSVCFSPKNGDIYFENETWELDKCTKCTCKNGVVLCDINYCPPTACANPIFDKRNCCPVCTNTTNDPMLEVLAKLSNLGNASLPGLAANKYWACFDKFENKRPHGTTWKESDCTHCVCVNGESKCFEETCKEMDCARQIYKKGQCCPYCLDHISSLYTDMLFRDASIDSASEQKSDEKSSFIHSTQMFIILTCIITILLLIIILLLAYILRKTTHHSLACQLKPSPSMKKPNITLNRFRLHTNDDDTDSYLNSFQDVQLINNAYAKTLQASLNSNGVISTTALLNNNNTNSSNTSSLQKPNGNYILYV